MPMPDEHIHPHATGRAAETVAAHQAENELVFYSGWFCPFVQRSWIALEEKGISYQYKEVNPYKKEAHFLAINPKGLVPALEYKGQPLNESLVIAEFVEDAFPEPPRLLPTDAFERARIRLWLDHVSKKILPPYFRLIQAQDASAQDAAREELYKAQRALAEQVKGPYFAGDQFTLIDAAVAPFVVRDYIIAEHRGYDRATASGAWKAYAEALETRESVQRTSSERQHYEEIMGRYLRDEAQSEVAKATRGGKDLP